MALKIPEGPSPSQMTSSLLSVLLIMQPARRTQLSDALAEVMHNLNTWQRLLASVRPCFHASAIKIALDVAEVLHEVAQAPGCLRCAF